jgi:hypothetical protein
VDTLFPSNERTRNNGRDVFSVVRAAVIKAVIYVRHLPLNTLAEDISDGLVSLSFDVIGVKQMIATRRSPSEGSTTINLPCSL